MGQRDGEQLIGPARRVIALLAVDDVEEIPFIAVPEALVEASLRPVGVGF